MTKWLIERVGLESFKSLLKILFENIEYVLFIVLGVVLMVFLGRNNKFQEKAREVKEKKGEVQEATEREKKAAEEDLEETKENREKRQKEAEKLDEKLENHFDN